MSRGILAGVTVLSLEQATTLPFLTYRLACDGARVIRVENAKRPDPNRFVGRDVLHEPAMRSYFLPNNCGKEAITLNLGHPEGQALLRQLIVKLGVDVFASNQRPRSYARLGIEPGPLAGREAGSDLARDHRIRARARRGGVRSGAPGARGLHGADRRAERLAARLRLTDGRSRRGRARLRRGDEGALSPRDDGRGRADRRVDAAKRGVVDGRARRALEPRRARDPQGQPPSVLRAGGRAPDPRRPRLSGDRQRSAVGGADRRCPRSAGSAGPSTPPTPDVSATSSGSTASWRRASPTSRATRRSNRCGRRACRSPA